MFYFNKIYLLFKKENFISRLQMSNQYQLSAVINRRQEYKYTVIFTYACSNWIGIPRWLSGKESTCQCHRRGLNPWVRKIPWRRKWKPTPVVLPGKSDSQRSLTGYSPWGRKELLRWLSDFYFHQLCRVICCFPGSSASEESPCNAGDPGSIPGSGRSLGEGKGYPFH